MKITGSKDGVMRATARIDFRVEFECFVLAAVEEFEEGAQCLYRRQIEKRLRQSLEDGGERWLSYGAEDTKHALDGTYDKFADEVVSEVRRLFPEFEREPVSA